MRRILRKLYFYAKYFVSTPIIFVLSIIYPFYKITLVKLFSDRIGHYALNTELILCALDENPALKKNHYFFYTCSSDVPICNSQLHKMWQRIILIVPFPVLAWQVDRVMKVLFKTYKNDPIKLQFEFAMGDYLGALKKGKVHLFFNEQEKIQGEKLQNELGIPAGAKFVCLIVRDSEYMKQHLPGMNWRYQDHRDADIDTYKKATLFLVEKGYYVIRMGKHVKKKFQIENSFVVDYANHSLRSDFMDIYLSSRCDFFITSTTGLDSVPRLFRKPGVLTNAILPAFEPTYPQIFFIPKKIRKRNDGQILTFSQYFKIYFSTENKSMLNYLKLNELELTDNSEDELLSVVKEMVSYLTGYFTESNDEKIAQKIFWNIFLRNLKNYDEVSTNGLKVDIKIGNSFLRENLGMLN
ncbi:MAG: TIGR04372 family glycosyltransferase [Gammaproteobacteria bacterium]|nr:TIGR04372 family glycosyltransferase [Gammaproteobacteria bacterium]